MCVCIQCGDIWSDEYRPAAHSSQITLHLQPQRSVQVYSRSVPSGTQYTHTCVSLISVHVCWQVCCRQILVSFVSMITSSVYTATRLSVSSTTDLSTRKTRATSTESYLRCPPNIFQRLIMCTHTHTCTVVSTLVIWSFMLTYFHCVHMYLYRTSVWRSLSQVPSSLAISSRWGLTLQIVSMKN